ncbi:(6-4)DNA photolyase [Porphyridium purpureum]|uniref:(6-4)DNA photolyase n=1 Tax=Porphyridium purpureum TaxID=35688 RepID=A0A5J4Z2J1_PORPP|nr:(6-4)DNA photolyase [Porphyridium purpureum]|eukprot:POR9749..scf208_2
MTQPVLFWFRKSLRVHDNLALKRAVEYAAQHSATLVPVFVIDPHFVNPDKVGVVRMNFLLESLQDLSSTLQQHRAQQLLVLRGNPEQVFPDLLFARKGSESGISALFFENDTEPYAKQRDTRVGELARKADVHVESCYGHTLYDPDWLLKRARGGRPPETMSAFTALMESVGPPSKPVSAEDVMKSLANTPQDDELLRKQLMSEAQPLSIPNLAELGYPDASPSRLFKGGESAALEKLREFCARKKGECVRKFAKPETNPAAFEPPETTTLSPYMKFGCLSPREFYHRVESIRNSKSTQPPVSLIGQLYWREHFTLLGYVTPNFDRMEGNPLCRRIDWDTTPEYVSAWESGKTGYPWIDACMRQLVSEGWLHHLARHSVACFLTRGDLWQSWEVGKAVFEKHLIDADWSLNAANWMWLSCSAFFHQYFRVYSPSAFPKKYSHVAAFIRKYVPELRAMPDAYLLEPWKAPEKVQREAGCLIGKHYPSRVVIHEDISKENIQRMKRAFELNKTERPSSTGTKRSREE